MSEIDLFTDIPTLSNFYFPKLDKHTHIFNHAINTFWLIGIVMSNWMSSMMSSVTKELFC